MMMAMMVVVDEFRRTGERRGEERSFIFSVRITGLLGLRGLGFLDDGGFG